MRSDPLTIQYDRAGAHLTVYLSGELDAASDDVLSDRLLSHVHPGDELVWLDLEAVSFFGSVGVTVLLRLLHHVESLGARLVIYRPSVAVMRVLELCEVDRLLPIRQPLGMVDSVARGR